jgi:AraC-like DNA-binding protein
VSSIDPGRRGLPDFPHPVALVGSLGGILSPSRSSGEYGAAIARPYVPGRMGEEDLPVTTVWIAHASADLAINVAERLRDLNVEVRCWEYPLAKAFPHPGIDPASTGRMHPKVSRGRAQGGLAPGALRRVREQIDRSLARKIDVRDLAAVASLSTSHFSRAFRASLGFPPHRYIMERRIDVAATLVRETSRPLTDIALEVGFADQSHFTRVFLHIKGEPPGVFRRRHR